MDKVERLHVISNSHIDPVWLWRRRCGRAEWLNTCWSVVRVMQENPDLTYSCADSSLYKWIESCDSVLFAAIKALIAAGRWEIVGGWVVQSDAILASGESLLRQAEHGKRYFQETFGVDVKVGYNPDAFGHSPGLPMILKRSGLDYYAFARQGDNQQVPPNVFRWLAADGSSVLASRMVPGYGQGANTSKEGFLKSIDWAFANGEKEQAFYFGVGDHGGGVHRRHLEWLREAMAGRNIVFSTLGGYFDSIKDADWPEFRGELGQTFRGCYSSCHEVKAKVARTERLLLKAEKLTATASLDNAWEELLFNHFHDIFPGTSVREAYETDVSDGLGHAAHVASTLLDRELFRLGAAADTSFMPEGGLLVWNPHPFPAKGLVAFDTFQDPNALGAPFSSLDSPDGSSQPLQFLAPATNLGPCGDPWGRLSAVVDLPPSGHKILAFGRQPHASPKLGFAAQRRLLERLALTTFVDRYSTWGHGMTDFGEPLAHAKLEAVVEAEDGQVASRLRAEYGVLNSHITVDLLKHAGVEELEIRLRLDWNDPETCLKFGLKSGVDDPNFVVGQSFSMVERDMRRGGAWQWSDRGGVPVHERLPASSGEVPMVNWAADAGADVVRGFYCADLHGCDHAKGQLRITLNRAVPYSYHPPFEPSVESGWMDMGRSWRNLWFFEFEGAAADLALIPRRAAARLDNAETISVTTHPGETPAEVAGFALDRPEVTLESLRRDASGKLVARLLNHASHPVKLLGVELAAHALLDQRLPD